MTCGSTLNPFSSGGRNHGLSAGRAQPVFSCVGERGCVLFQKESAAILQIANGASPKAVVNVVVVMVGGRGGGGGGGGGG